MVLIKENHDGCVQICPVRCTVQMDSIWFVRCGSESIWRIQFLLNINHLVFLMYIVGNIVLQVGYEG